MNIGAFDRLIDNLEAPPIRHNQLVWLQNGHEVFVISEEKRWSCATNGCAAGFIFLAEAPEGSVFDTRSERVFPDQAAFDKYTEMLDECKYIGLPGEDIVSWAAKVLDVDHSDAYDLFYNTDADTEETIRLVKALKEEYSKYYN